MSEKENPLSDAVMDIPESDRQLAQKIRKRYTAGVAYKRSQGYFDTWAEADRFWNADQWPEPDEDTDKFPRPVTNHFASIIEQKIASLVYDAPDIHFEPQEPQPEQTTDDEAAELLTNVAKFQAHKLELDELLSHGTRDAALMGTGIWYFPWDNTIMGGSAVRETLFVGDITGTEIDPADFFPGDPTDREIQSQPFILLAERRPLDEVKEFYRRFSEVVDIIQPERMNSDTQVYDGQRNEVEETGYVDVVHMWDKEPDKEQPGHKCVYYTVQCQGYIIRPRQKLYQHGLYPFSAFQWYPKRKSFFGKSEAVDLINNQKEINHLDGIVLLSAYFTGMPQRRFRDGFVDERDLTNEPGGAIRDTSPPGPYWGVDYLQPPQMPGYPAVMRDKLEASMKDASGVHEAFSGKAPGSDLNASAIIALQEAAGVRIRGIQRRLYKATRDIARIWLAHWKEFCSESRLVRIAGEGSEAGYQWFRGTDYADMAFDVLVQAGPSSPFSKSLYMSQLDKMLQGQVIDADEYLELLPADVFPKVQQIIEKRKEKQEQMMEQQMMMQQQIPEQMGQMPGMPGDMGAG